MRPRSLAHLAVLIVIGLEKLHFSVAFENPAEYDFPFKIPFREAVGAIHREFPLQVKYMKEVMHSIPVPQEKTNPEPAIINKNQEDNKQTEELKPQVELTKSPIEEKEIRSHFEVVKEAMDGEQEEAGKKPSIKKDSPGDYNPDEDNSPGSESDDESLDDDEEEEEDDDSDDDEDEEEDDEEEEEEEEEYEGEDTTDEKTDNESNEDDLDATFPYILSMQIMGPENQSLRHVKTGIIKASPDGSIQKDDLVSLMMSLKNDEGECLPNRVPADSSEDEEKQEKMHEQIHISVPAVRYSSQVMDQQGTIYRQEGIRPLPLAVASYFQNKQENSPQKQEGAVKAERPESSVEKEVTNQPEQPESTHDTIKEVLPTKPKYQKEIQMKEIAKKSKPVDNRVYPKKYNPSDNFNSKLPGKVFEYKILEGSGEEEFDYNTEEGSGQEEFEFNTQEGSGQEEFEYNTQEGSGHKEFVYKTLEGSGQKESDFEDDKKKESEEVKKFILIRPRPRVFQASVGLDGISKTDGIFKKDGIPVKAAVASVEGTVKKNDDVISSDKTHLSFRHFWTPLKQILVSKIFGDRNVRFDDKP